MMTDQQVKQFRMYAERGVSISAPEIMCLVEEIDRLKAASNSHVASAPTFRGVVTSRFPRFGRDGTIESMVFAVTTDGPVPAELTGDYLPKHIRYYFEPKEGG
jgi:hypothetical protein